MSEKQPAILPLLDEKQKGYLQFWQESRLSEVQRETARLWTVWQENEGLNPARNEQTLLDELLFDSLLAWFTLQLDDIDTFSVSYIQEQACEAVSYGDFSLDLYRRIERVKLCLSDLEGTKSKTFRRAEFESHRKLLNDSLESLLLISLSSEFNSGYNKVLNANPWEQVPKDDAVLVFSLYSAVLGLSHQVKTLIEEKNADFSFVLVAEGVLAMEDALSSSEEVKSEKTRMCFTTALKGLARHVENLSPEWKKNLPANWRV